MWDIVGADTALSRRKHSPCGSELAHEGVVSAMDVVTDTLHSRASSLPQVLHASIQIGCAFIQKKSVLHSFRKIGFAFIESSRSIYSFNPTGQVSLSLYPSGHGSLGSSMCWCVPVIHARPDRLGMIALRPATSVSLWILQ